MTSDPLPSAEVAAFSVWRRMRFVLPLQIVFVLIAIGFAVYRVPGRAGARPRARTLATGRT